MRIERTMMPTETTAKRFAKLRKPLRLSLLLIFATWLIDPAINSFTQQQSSYFQRLFSPEPAEVYTRTIISILLILTALALRYCFRQQQKILINDRKKLSQIIKCGPECIKMVAKDGALLEMNPAGLAIIEAENFDQVKGQSVYDLIAPEHRENFIELNRQVFEGKDSCLEFELITLKGNRKWVDTTATPLRDAEDNIVSHLAVTRDISDRKRADKQLMTLYNELESRVEQRTEELSKINHALKEANIRVEQSAAAKANFLAAMSHEIRTPMNGVLGTADLLLHTPLSDEQKQYLRVIQRSGKTLVTVINDILDYSKVEAGKLELDITPFSFSGFLKETLMPYQHQSNRELNFGVSIDPKLPDYLYGDTVRLHQILSNLLNNAFKFTHKGYVNLEVKALDSNDNRITIQFSVTDTGEGISESSQQHLFEPFTQADQSTTRKYGGTGLGLSICKQLVEEMKGSIDVTSQPGKGSTFKFTIELKVAQPPHSRALNSEDVNSYKQLKVLLVDDNQVNRLVAKNLLTKLGVELEVSSSGAQAIELICHPESDFNLVLMDCEMPGIDGYSATESIRQWEEENGRSPINIYACTAHALPENKEKCLQAGMNDILLKPVSMESLSNALEKFVTDSNEQPI